jgi:hypothetical protein
MIDDTEREIVDAITFVFIIQKAIERAKKGGYLKDQIPQLLSQAVGPMGMAVIQKPDSPH